MLWMLFSANQKAEAHQFVFFSLPRFSFHKTPSNKRNWEGIQSVTWILFHPFPRLCQLMYNIMRSVNSRKHHSISNTYNVSKQGSLEWMTYRLLLSEKMIKLYRDFCSSGTCWDSERRKLSAPEKMSALLFISELRDFTLGVCQCFYHGLSFYITQF